MPAYNLMKRDAVSGEWSVETTVFSSQLPHITWDATQDFDKDYHLNVMNYLDWTVSPRVVCTPENYRFEVYKDPQWRAREKGRFDRGIYQALPWDLEAITDHYAHVSTENGAMIAYTPDDEKGQVDRQTRIKPGRYLKKFYPDLTSDEIRALAVLVDKACEVQFAVTADDIETVYLKGPNSCMSKPLHFYSSPVHPVRVYGDSDLQLAYLSSLQLDHEDFKASSRALVWPERMIYGRVYGDEQRMTNALEALGYTPEDFEGAKVARIMHEGGYVMPYVDGIGHFDDHGSHLVLTDSGEYECRETNGMANDKRNYCEYHEERTSEDVVYINNLGQQWSESAAQDHAFECSGYGSWYSNDMESFEIGGQLYSERYLESHGFYCERSNEWFLDSDDSAVTLSDTGETVALSWAESDDDAFYLESTDTWYSQKPSEAALIEAEGQMRLNLAAPAVLEKAASEASVAIPGAFTKGDRVSGTWMGDSHTGTVVGGPDRDGDYVVAITNGSGWTHHDGTPNCWYLHGRSLAHIEAPTVAPSSPGVIAVGDTVRCVSSDDDFTPIRNGQTYEVLEVSPEYLWVRANGAISGGWRIDRFVKVSEAPTVEPLVPMSPMDVLRALGLAA